jgi:hypothetical protein
MAAGFPGGYLVYIFPQFLHTSSLPQPLYRPAFYLPYPFPCHMIQLSDLFQRPAAAIHKAEAQKDHRLFPL